MIAWDSLRLKHKHQGDTLIVCHNYGSIAVLWRQRHDEALLVLLDFLRLLGEALGSRTNRSSFAWLRSLLQVRVEFAYYTDTVSPPPNSINLNKPCGCLLEVLQLIYL